MPRSNSTPAPVITLALMGHFRSRDDDLFTGELLASVRCEFGGLWSRMSKRTRGSLSPAQRGEGWGEELLLLLY